MSDTFDPDLLNDSELALIAANAHPEAHRGLPREVLVAIIEGFEVDLPQRFVNKKRLQVMSWINENWSQVRYQVSCPAKTQDPHACFGCTDFQVACCLLDNSNKFLADEKTER